jgi:hypothetical protein
MCWWRGGVAQVIEIERSHAVLWLQARIWISKHVCLVFQKFIKVERRSFSAAPFSLKTRPVTVNAEVK